MLDGKLDWKGMCEAVSFTLTDMSLWCGLPTATVRSWVLGKSIPHSIRYRHLRKCFDLLEWTLKNAPDKLPVPIDVRASQRKSYILQVRNYATAAISKEGASE